MFTNPALFTDQRQVRDETVCAPEELVFRINDAVEDLLAESRIFQPPVWPRTVAEHFGLRICINTDQQERGRLASRKKRTIVAVKAEPRLERAQWTIAHEIAEHLIVTRLFKLFEDWENDWSLSRESLANYLANAILVPPAWLKAQCAISSDLFSLKNCFESASHEVIARQLLLIESGVIVTVFDQQLLTWRKANLEGGPPPLQSIERLALREAHESARKTHWSDETLDVDVWPIHEQGWKREIMRTRPMDPDW